MRSHRGAVECVVFGVVILVVGVLAVSKGAVIAAWAAAILTAIVLAGMATMQWLDYRSHRHEADVTRGKAREALAARKKLRMTCEGMLGEVQAVSPERAAQFESQLHAIDAVGAPVDAIFYTTQRAKVRLLSARGCLDQQMTYEYCRESFEAAVSWYQKMVPELYFATPAGLKHHLSLMSGALRAHAFSLGQYEKQFDVSAAWRVYARLVVRLRTFEEAWPKAELSEVAFLQTEIQQFGAAVERIGDISKRFLQEAEMELADVLQGTLSRLDGLAHVSPLLPRLHYKWAFWRARRFLDRLPNGRLTADQAAKAFNRRLDAIEGAVPEELVERDQKLLRRKKVSEIAALQQRMQDDIGLASSILSAVAMTATDTPSSPASCPSDGGNSSAGDSGGPAMTC